VSLRGTEARAAAPPAAIVLPFSAGYFLSYLFRSVNAVIAPELVAEFSLSATQLGLLTAAYFLAFGAFQIPLGMLLDRFGPRRTNAALLLIAGTGAMLFGAAGSPAVLFGARALIGLGVCGCLMSSIKAFTLWFPIGQLPARSGWVFFAGGLGAVASTAPVEAVLAVIDWRGVFIALGAACMVVSGAIFFVVPERASGRATETLAQQMAGVVMVFRSATFWRIALASTLFQALNMAIQGLWAGPWLADVARLDRSEIAKHLLALGGATMCGFLFWGACAARLARRGVAPFTVFVAATGVFLAVQLPLVLGATTSPLLLWGAFGFFGTSGSLAFTIVSQSFPMALTGRANTALNLLVFLTAFGTQWLFGAIVDLWPAPSGGYLADGYSAAFGFFFVLELFAFAWMLRARPATGERAELR
jgi:sugar phosphate permease